MRNRIIGAPTGYLHLDAESLPTQACVAYYELKARGGAFSDPAMMDRVIAEGKVDGIAIARGLICDPDLPVKARAGKDDQINRCIQCLYCFSNLLETRHFSCALNPIIGRELEDKYDTLPVTPKTVIPTWMDGYDLPNVFPAEEIYFHPEKAGKNVVICGAGLVGCELAIHLYETGHQVTILQRSATPRFTGNFLQGQAIMAKFEETDIRILKLTRAKFFTPEGVLAEGPEGSLIVPADTVIYAVGYQPLSEETDALRSCAPYFYSIGDCNKPETIAKAVKEGFYAARDIGRI